MLRHEETHRTRTGGEGTRIERKVEVGGPCQRLKVARTRRGNLTRGRSIRAATSLSDPRYRSAHSPSRCPRIETKTQGRREEDHKFRKFSQGLSWVQTSCYSAQRIRGVCEKVRRNLGKVVREHRAGGRHSLDVFCMGGIIRRITLHL